jgi:hypothetical protein
MSKRPINYVYGITYLSFPKNVPLLVTSIDKIKYRTGCGQASSINENVRFPRTVILLIMATHFPIEFILICYRAELQWFSHDSESCWRPVYIWHKINRYRKSIPYTNVTYACFFTIFKYLILSSKESKFPKTWVMSMNVEWPPGRSRPRKRWMDYVKVDMRRWKEGWMRRRMKSS